LAYVQIFHYTAQQYEHRKSEQHYIKVLVGDSHKSTIVSNHHS